MNNKDTNFKYTKGRNIKEWLPTTAKEVKNLGWEELDVILFTGDAYIDHPAFGAAVIGRVLEKMGLRVAVVPQPNWQDDLRDFKKLGKPKLFFAVTAGNMDSMVNHYTANKRLRSDDAYTPDGRAGARPDYAVTVYTKILKKLYPDSPVILGGIEASLRRFTHYDYWADELRPSILYSSGADLLVYGNGEKSIEQISRIVRKGVPVHELKTIPQTAVFVEKEKTADNNLETCPLYSHKECLADKQKFAKNFKFIEIESNKIHAKTLIQKTFNKTLLVNPPYPKTTEKEADRMYALPYTRLPHPKYAKKGLIPAYEMIKFSINSHRGCFGGCSFCTISAHQGKFIVSRSEDSILDEAKIITQMPEFKGYISDIGGPTANMYKMQGYDISICEMCTRPSCIFPSVCKNLNTDHSQLTEVYKKVRNIEGIKKAFIGSGVRYDMLYDSDQNVHKDKYDYANELISHHVSGRLKVAPEHTSDRVLKYMRKPSFSLFKRFVKLFEEINKKAGLKQQLIPYFISSHPSSTEEDMAELAAETKALNFRLEQVQDFTPTPMTHAAVTFYSGLDPYKLDKVYSAKKQKDKKNQRLFFFGYKKEYKGKIITRLKKMNRSDLLKRLFH
ncbi:MAG: YgiQ family radical SAM protein [Bacteroidota bacterium]|nr:YgiQ family radical SAM protein [Bacteroidota bacterium]